MSELKACWWCKYFYYKQASADYSEWTPGDSFGMACGKDHWTFDAYDTSQDEFGKILQTAATCVDYHKERP